MTDTFAALSDPTRRFLLDRLSEQGGLTLSALAEGLPMTRQAVAKHLAVLEAAELVASERDGRCKRHYLIRCRWRKWRGGGWAGSRGRPPLAAMAGFRNPDASDGGGRTAVRAGSAHS